MSDFEQIRLAYMRLGDMEIRVAEDDLEVFFLILLEGGFIDEEEYLERIAILTKPHLEPVH